MTMIDTAVRELSSHEAKTMRVLDAKLRALRHHTAMALATGSAKSGEAMATAQNYADAVGYMRGLQHVLDLLSEVEDEVVGRNRNVRS